MRFLEHAWSYPKSFWKFKKTFLEKVSFRVFLSATLKKYQAGGVDMPIGEGRRFFILIDSVLTEMLSCKQAAYHYNFHIRTIRKWVDEGKISAVEIEGRWWIPKADLEAFLKGNDHK